MFKVLSTAILAASLAACSAKVSSDGGGGGAVIPVDKFSDDVPAIDLAGTWNSSCVRDRWSDGYVIFNVVIKGKAILRTETKFSDSACALQVSQLTRDGIFRFKAKYGADIYELEYKFNMKNGHYYTGDNVRRMDHKM